MSLQEAIEHAAEHLPDFWLIHVIVERGSAWVSVEEPDGTMHELDIGPESLENQVMAGLIFAQKEEVEQGEDL